MVEKKLRPHKVPFDIERDFDSVLDEDGITGQRRLLIRLHLEKYLGRSEPITYAHYNAVRDMLRMAYDEPEYKDNPFFSATRSVSQRLLREHDHRLLNRIFGGIKFDDTVTRVEH